MAVGLIDDPRFQEHVPRRSHPERPERLAAIGRALTDRGLRERTAGRTPRPATRRELARVHTPAYLDLLEENLPGQQGMLDGDTYFSPRSWEIARHAAGAAIDLATEILDPDRDMHAAFAAVRPPGHHAEADHAMGFCLFNNAAVAAAAARAAGAARVAIFDWDVHHGNGTQHVFYDRADILYLSTHQYPFYPGTGRLDETGAGAGKGFTVNVPMPAGLGDADYALVFDRIIAPVIDQYAPDLLILSAGFDAHRADPLGGMGLSDEAFARLAREARRVAARVSSGRVLALLEGGYDIEALARCACGLVEELLVETEPDAAPATGEAAAVTHRLIDEARRVHAEHWNL